ncbi:helix-turn-helix domain-containing protein [Frateuria defendens]|uniref:helix-turn-helix domain-containing protein n=1 Tax=Frateuria defendens TaxID=2219559 RepID=UPI0007DC2205|nr:helix-turn-helix domain-containing protein [Frateuria defendens]
MPPSTPYAAFADRLHRACDKAGVPAGRQRVTAMADRFGVARETARLWFAGRALPELSRLIEIAGELDCSLDWLAMGRGTPQPGAKPSRRVADPAATYDALTPQERAVVTAMRDLSEKRRAGLVALLAER